MARINITAMHKKSAANTSFHIETLGCPKNRVDSRRMRTSFLRLGYHEASEPENADIFLINSCSFIREAQEETIQTVFDTLKIKEKKTPHMKVGLVGCFVERFSDAVKKDIPELDFTIGTQRYHEVGSLVSEKFAIKPAAHAADFATEFVSVNADSHKPFAWLRIAQGCNRKCAFCIIPKIRGDLIPYSIDAVEKQYIDETLLRGGNRAPIREVVLVSQDTISQGVDELERIIAHLSQKEEIRWIRLQYLFPDRRVLELLELWKKYPKLTPYLDIPFQHASPQILKAMKRPSDTGLFTEIIERAHAITPDFEIRTSFIVGFPGETERDFTELENFIDRHRIDKLALFRYSHEIGTSAGDSLPETIKDDEKYRRINQLRDAHLEKRKQYALGLIGRREIMLVDEITPTNGSMDSEVTLRRAHDAPESDEIVTAAIPKNSQLKVGGKEGILPAADPRRPCLSVGDMPLVELKVYTEYSFLGEIVSTP